MTGKMGGSDTLSIHRSFIVRLYPAADLDAANICGRIEHVISGEAGEFRSVEDLLVFVRRSLCPSDPGSDP